jgi:two-component system, LuxR family, sensor kinase FixL
MSRTTFSHHLSSAGMVALASLLRIPIENWVGVGPSPSIFIPSVVIASRFGGLGAGVVAVLLWAVFWVCLDLPPGDSGTIRRLDDQYRVVVFLMEGMILAGAIEALNLALRAPDETALEFERYRKVSSRNEAGLRAILEHSSAPIWMKDLEGRYLVVNRRFETLVRRSAPEMVGRTHSELALPPIAGNLSDSDRMVIEYGRAVEVEEVIPSDDGTRTFLSVKFPLADEGGTPYAIGGILTDITELKEAQRRAVQAERLAAIGQMVAGLAHESRNALQRGQACLEMLAFRLEDRPETLDLLSGIQDAQDDLSRLYEEVRCYAAPIRLELLDCRLSEVLREAWEQLAPARRGRDARLVEGRPVDHVCQADRRRLVQVFRNVLDNALGASQGPARIEVAWSEVHLNGQPAVRIALRDHGSGLNPEQQSRLFEPFYTTKTQGTGLGMAIARRIVEAHGGSIEVGRNHGPGAEIVIVLPRRQDVSSVHSTSLEGFRSGGGSTAIGEPARLRAS